MLRAVVILVLASATGCSGKNAGTDAGSTASGSASASARAPYDPAFVQSLCLMAATSPAPGGGKSWAGVLTDGRARHPWLARDYDLRFLSMTEIDATLALLGSDARAGLRGLMPSTFCPSALPAYLTLIVQNAKEQDASGIWVISGEVRSLEREFMPGATRKQAMEKGAAMVAKAMGAAPRVEAFETGPGVRETGLTAAAGESWAEIFEATKR